MKRILFTVGALLLTFTAGMATGMKSVPFAIEINPGLVEALNSVGQNLFGSDAFGVSNVGAITPDDDMPAGVQLDVVARVGAGTPDDDLPFHKIINLVVGYPPDDISPPECMTFVQITVGADGSISGIYDARVQALHPDLLNFTLEAGTPTGHPFCSIPPADDI